MMCPSGEPKHVHIYHESRCLQSLMLVCHRHRVPPCLLQDCCRRRSGGWSPVCSRVWWSVVAGRGSGVDHPTTVMWCAQAAPGVGDPRQHASAPYTVRTLPVLRCCVSCRPPCHDPVGWPRSCSGRHCGGRLLSAEVRGLGNRSTAVAPLWAVTWRPDSVVSSPVSLAVCGSGLAFDVTLPGGGDD